MAISYIECSIKRRVQRSNGYVCFGYGYSIPWITFISWGYCPSSRILHPRWA